MPHLPNKAVRTLEQEYKNIYEKLPLYIEIQLHDADGVDSDLLSLGGMWSSLDLCYTPMTDDDKHFNKTVQIHPKQWKLLQYIIKAMNNEDLDIPIIDIILFGARRGGKSLALVIALLSYCIARPGSECLILSTRIDHGAYIINKIKTWLDPTLWSWEARDDRLTLCNTSYIRCKSIASYGAQRGKKYHCIVYDECAPWVKDIYEDISPATTDYLGVNILASTTRGHNWFYQLYKKSCSRKISESSQVKSVGMSIHDNTFFNEKQIQFHLNRGLTFDKQKYQQEILGEWMSYDGQALPDFNEDLHVKSWPLPNKKDVTAELSQYIWGERYNFLVQMDFNLDPMVGTVFKVYGDGTIHIIQEIVDNQRTAKWGQKLLRVLTGLGEPDPLTNCLIIADASGRRQGIGRNAYRDVPTWQILEKQGWILDSPTGTPHNPLRIHRLEIVRALLLNMRDEVKVYIDPACPNIIQCWDELTLRRGIPDMRSKWIDYYDGSTYGLYRIHGTTMGEEFFGYSLTNSLQEQAEIKEIQNDMEDSSSQ